MGHHVALGAVVHFVERRAQMDDRRHDRLSVHPRDDMAQHGSPKQVITAKRVVSKPIELQDAKAAQALSGAEDGAEVLLIGGDLQRAAGRFLDRSPPLPRPAHGGDDPAAAVLEVEERRVRGRAAVLGAESVWHARGERLIEGHPVVVGTRAALEPMQDRRQAGARRDRNIHGLQLLDDRRVRRPGVREREGPIRPGGIRVDRADRADPKPGRRIGDGQRPYACGGVDGAILDPPRPGPDEGRRGPTAIDERKRQGLRRRRRESRLRPSAVRGDFVVRCDGRRGGEEQQERRK